MKFLRVSILILCCAFSDHVFAGSDPKLTVYPNPFVDHIQLRIYSETQDSLNIQIVDIIGKILMVINRLVPKGTSAIPISFRNTPIIKAGLYFCTVKLSKDSNAYVQKLVSQGDPNTNPTFDILHQGLSLTIRNLSAKQIHGTCAIQLVAKTDSLRSIKLDLLRLTVSTVKIDTITQSFNQNDSQLFITFAKPMIWGDTFTISITYGGSPVADAKWGGFYFSGNFAYNLGVGFASNPHSFGRCWFPCVDEFTEKSTYSFHITTDSGWSAVCNGTFQNKTLNPDGSGTWNWEQHDPISAYLASVAVGQYELVTMTFNGMLKSYPVWIAAEVKDTSNARKSMVHLLDALQCFESKFGPYPFERVGYVGVPFTGGAMEHAGNIAYPNYALDGTTTNETLFAHELSHMWFGDMVTCRTPEDMWLNEGWASYCEAVFLECLYGKERYTEDIKSKLQTVLLSAPKADGAFYPVSGVPHDATYGTHVYKKGALVAHTLRTMMGDSAFFAACKSYLNKFRYANAGSDDLMDEFQRFTPVNLTDFFDQWVYSKGYEDLVISSYSINNRKLHMNLADQVRYRTAGTNSIPLNIDIVSSSGAKQHAVSSYTMGENSLDIDLDNAIQDIAYIVVNPDLSMAFGNLGDVYSIKSKGAVNLSNQLVNLNVTDVSDSAVIRCEHHWTEPFQGDLRSTGIRISPERYWRFDGTLPFTFKAYAFFNYDGTPANFLDADLLKNNSTEDSLVLLFRPLTETNWKIHTDNTFQPGSSKTDKIGRFWVNKLEKGDYAFGIRDYKVTGVNPEQKEFSNRIALYPNPASDLAFISFEKPYSGQLVVSDTNGRIVYQETLKKAENLKLDVSRFRSGIYFISTQAGEAKMNLKFMVK